jgi:hypothetical protein
VLLILLLPYERYRSVARVLYGLERTTHDSQLSLLTIISPTPKPLDLVMSQWSCYRCSYYGQQHERDAFDEACHSGRDRPASARAAAILYAADFGCSLETVDCVINKVSAYSIGRCQFMRIQDYSMQKIQPTKTAILHVGRKKRQPISNLLFRSFPCKWRKNITSLPQRRFSSAR